uniref:dermonecrotic toxin domain-containing protein n=1 Tax=Pseudomonas sp. TaxID=306 RepID=UPI00345D57BA
EKPSTLKLESAHSITVTGKNGEALKSLDKTFIADLSERLSNPVTVNTFMVERLENSIYAKSLLMLATRLSRMQMRLGLLSATAQDLPQHCLEWIKSVIDAPGASADRQVKGQKILVTFLAINKATLSNVLKIAPQDSSEQGMVLCTLNAPDGIVFRWFANMASAKSDFLDKPDFSHYLMLQLPIANRPRALRSLQLDQRLKSYRFPEFFKYLPSPVPIPDLLWEAISFVEQTRDFLTENHDLKIAHLRTDATANLLSAREVEIQQNYTAMHMTASIALLFLPPPASIPIALGLGLYKAWNGFRAIEEDDFEGAAREFLFALDYLVTAGIGKLALASRPLLPSSRIRGLRQPIARRIGADGEPHIGILRQHPTPGLSGTGEGSVLFDALKFQRIEIDNQAFYVRPYANLFGHKKLYRRLAQDSSMLTELDEFALRSNEGQWLKAPYQASGISAQTYLKASQHLDRLIAEWPTAVQHLTPLQRLRFEADYLSLANANTHLFPEVEAYCEGGSAAINNALRTNIVSSDATAFVQEFYQLDEYRGQAFRAAYVSANGLERLQGEPGIIFADKGIQSASISPLNASRWSDDDYIIQSASSDDRAIFMIFDPSIPKKNMFTSFLGDHVGIAPETPLQLMAFKTVDNVNYAYFSAPEQIPQFYIDTYTGRQAAFP